MKTENKDTLSKVIDVINASKLVTGKDGEPVTEDTTLDAVSTILNVVQQFQKQNADLVTTIRVLKEFK